MYFHLLGQLKGHEIKSSVLSYNIFKQYKQGCSFHILEDNLNLNEISIECYLSSFMFFFVFLCQTACLGLSIQFDQLDCGEFKILKLGTSSPFFSIFDQSFPSQNLFSFLGVVNYLFNQGYSYYCCGGSPKIRGVLKVIEVVSLITLHIVFETMSFDVIVFNFVTIYILHKFASQTY